MVKIRRKLFLMVVFGIFCCMNVIASSAAMSTVSLYGDTVYVIKTNGDLLRAKLPSDDIQTEKLLENVIHISKEYAVTEDGSLWTWGNRSQFFYNGNGSWDNITEPCKVMENVKSVLAGADHTLIIKNDGSLWGIGWNLYGQLAQGMKVGGSYQPEYIYEPVYIMDNVISAKAGYNHSIVLKSDGTVWTFGNNEYGQLGTGSDVIMSNKPSEVLDNAKAVYAGGDSCFAILNDEKNTLCRWGTNYAGRLGGPKELDKYLPESYLNGVKTVSALWGYTLVTKNDGALWAYGETENAERVQTLEWNGGEGYKAFIDTPVQITGDVECVVAQQNGEGGTALVLKNNGELYLFELTGEEEQQYTLTKILDEVRLSDETPGIHQKLVVSVSEMGINILLNDKSVQFPDAEPFVDENNRTQIPVRALAELLDFNVSWNGDTLTAELTKDDTVVTIKIGENQITKNGETIEMDTAAKVVNDRTYIPLRFVGEALGCDVEWEN